MSYIYKVYSSLLIPHDRKKRFFAHFKQLHGTGKSSGVTSLEITVGTKVPPSVKSYP